MKVNIGLELTDEQLLALGTTGKRGARKPATRAQVREWVEAQVRALDDHGVRSGFAASLLEERLGPGVTVEPGIGNDVIVKVPKNTDLDAVVDRLDSLLEALYVGREEWTVANYQLAGGLMQTIREKTGGVKR